MAERIYTRGAEGGLEPLEEEPFLTEDDLQSLIAQHLELLDGEQIRPRAPRRWLLVTREKGISETSDSGARWAVDHLIVDQDATPTLVEVKRGSNSEIRRSMVGQVLEYAAHASRSWTADELRRAFEEAANAQGQKPSELLEGLLQSDGEPDADGFWEKVATNLSAKRMRLLFVSDEIPDPLERVVEFLNEQMPNIEVLAVEIKQFRGKSTQTLVPRVLGRIADASAGGVSGRRRSLSRETFLDQFTVAEVRNAAARILDVARDSGATFEWGQRGGVSVRGHCSRWEQPITVAWLYSPSMKGSGWMRTRDFTFGVAILEYDPAPDEELRSVLQKWADTFRDDSFTADVSSQGVTAWSVAHDSAPIHIDLLESRLSGVLSELKSL